MLGRLYVVISIIGCNLWEKAHAGRFRFLRERDNFIIRHGMLRMLLGAYLGSSPSRLNFTAGPNGKPEIQTCRREGRTYFNVSHSRDVAIFGITGACPIGVDVECIQPVPDYEGIAREFFSQTEAESLMGLPAKLRFECFYNLWTRREALVKATGDGLGSGQMPQSAPLFRPDGSKLREPSPSLGASDEWNICSFSPREGYVATVAFRKPGLGLICRSAPVFFSEGFRASDQRPLRIQAGI